MIEDSVAEDFDTLIEEAMAVADTNGDYEAEMEPICEKILLLIKSNENEKKAFIDIFKKCIFEYRSARESMEKTLPILVVSYCMHELRWIEILDFCRQENEEFYSKKMATTMHEIIDAFNDDWEDKLFYKRFN